MASATTLRKLFVDELRDAYHAEKQLTKALPKLMKAASSPELREAFESHLGETEEHVKRLEQVFEALGESAKAKPCAGMMGILEEGSKVLEEVEKGAIRDAALIAAAQRAEHYEMAAYGSLLAWANALGEDGAVEPLEATLEEEKAADEKLSELAEGGINAEAAGGDDAEADESDDEVNADRPTKTARRSGSMKPSSRRKVAQGAAARREF